MAEIAQSIAVAFAKQVAQGTYNANLATFPDPLNVADGLVLGVGDEGIKDSGLLWGRSRVAVPRPIIGTGFTRPPSAKRRVDTTQFQFTYPFGGNRAAASTPPVDSDFPPNAGEDALLEACGMVGSAWSGGVGHSYKMDPANAALLSALVYLSGMRFQPVDCRAGIEITFRGGEQPRAAAGVFVPGLETEPPIAAAIPATLDFTPLDSEDVAVYGDPAAGFTYGQARSSSEIVVSIQPSISDVPDSESNGGIRKKLDDIEIKVSGTLWESDADTDFSEIQLDADSALTLASLSFTAGAAAGNGAIMRAVRCIFPKLELESYEADDLDNGSVVKFEGVARNDTANEEAEIIFL